MARNYNWKPEVQQIMDDNRFTELTPVQRDSFPVIMKGRDLIAVSPTGTGKSHAYIIPVMQKIDETLNQTQALVVVPTYELAVQVTNMFRQVNDYTDRIRIQLVSNRNSIKNTIPHIVVGTVGKLKQLFVDEPILRLEKTRMLVIDEADMTLEAGFIEDMNQICSKLPDSIQTMVFSATLPKQIQPFLRHFMKSPVIVEINEKHFSNPQIEHILVNCKHMIYVEKLLKILPGINPYVCLIFVRKKDEVLSVGEALRNAGYKALEIHSGLSTRERKSAINLLYNSNNTYVVCSDVIARGMDIPSVSHVISLGLPSNNDYYVHRSGRTGRAGRTGISYVLYNDNDTSSINALKNKGINFQNMDYKNGAWVKVRIYQRRKSSSSEEASKAIIKIVSKPVKKVKPGYRKKMEKEIEDIKKRERRLMIKQSIKAQQKERAKAAQRRKAEGTR